MRSSKRFYRSKSSSAAPYHIAAGRSIFFSLLTIGLFLMNAAGSFGQEKLPCPFDPDFSVDQASLMLASADHESKLSALLKIKNCRSESLARIAIPSLKDIDPTIKAVAASALIALPPDEAALNIMPLLKDRSEFVRREAAYALGKIESQAPVSALISMLTGKEDAEVRSAVVIALGSIGSYEALEPLYNILRQRPKEEDEFLRRSSARAIGQIAEKLRSDNSDPASPHSFLPSELKPLRNDDKDLTGSFPQFKQAFATLSIVLNNNAESADTKREAVFALGSIGDTSAIPLIEKLAESPDPFIAETAREALQKLRRN